MGHDAMIDLSSESPKRRKINFDSMLRAISLFVLIATQILLIGFLTVWSVQGLLNSGLVSFLVLIAVVGAPCAWAIWRTAIGVFDAETDPDVS